MFGRYFRVLKYAKVRSHCVTNLHYSSNSSNRYPPTVILRRVVVCGCVVRCVEGLSGVWSLLRLQSAVPSQPAQVHSIVAAYERSLKP